MSELSASCNNGYHDECDSGWCDCEHHGPPDARLTALRKEHHRYEAEVRVIVESREATITAERTRADTWRQRAEEAEEVAGALRVERDVAMQRRHDFEPCDPCKEERHDDCTGDCSSMCCALADATSKVTSLTAALERIRRTKDWKVIHAYVDNALTTPAPTTGHKIADGDGGEFHGSSAERSGGRASVSPGAPIPSAPTTGEPKGTDDGVVFVDCCFVNDRPPTTEEPPESFAAHVVRIQMERSKHSPTTEGTEG